MLIEFEAYREKKDENGIPYLYLLRSQSDKNLYCVIRIEDDVPVSLGTSFNKSKQDIESEDWDKLSDSRKNVEDYIIKNMDTDMLVELENNFMQPDPTNEEKTLLINFE